MHVYVIHLKDMEDIWYLMEKRRTEDEGGIYTQSGSESRRLREGLLRCGVCSAGLYMPDICSFWM